MVGPLPLGRQEKEETEDKGVTGYRHIVPWIQPKKKKKSGKISPSKENVVTGR